MASFTITFDANLFVAGGTEPTPLTVHVQPFRPAGWPIPLGGTEFGVKDSIRAVINPDSPTLVLEGTGSDWCWKFQVTHADVDTTWIRYLFLTADVNFLSMVDLNPADLDPAIPTPAAWTIALNAEIARAEAAEDDLQDQIDAFEAGDVETVAGVGPDGGGDVPAASLKTALSLPADTAGDLADNASDIADEVSRATTAEGGLDTRVDALEATEATYGDIVTHNASEFTTDAELAAEAALARNANNLTSGTVADARIPAGITRDSELATVATTGDYDDLIDKPTGLPPTGAAGGVLSGTYPNPGFAADMATQAELDAEAALARNADNLTSGTVPDARLASGITRDSELAPVAFSGDYDDLTDKPTGLPPTGAAGGVLSGTYPNPGFAADMATQAELDAHINDPTDAHDGSAISLDSNAFYPQTQVQAMYDAWAPQLFRFVNQFLADGKGYLTAGTGVDTSDQMAPGANGAHLVTDSTQTNGLRWDTTDLATQAELDAEAALARNADNLTSGTVADARIAGTIARDSEVTAAVAAEAVLARNADNLTSGTVADARIASTIARDSEVTAAVAAETARAEAAEADLQDQIDDVEAGDVDSVNGVTGDVIAQLVEFPADSGYYEFDVAGAGDPPDPGWLTAANTLQNEIDGVWKPSDNSLLAASYNPAYGTYTVLPGAGVPVFSRVRVPAGVAITNIVTFAVVAGSGLTYAAAAVYEEDGTRSGITGSQVTAWQSGGRKVMPLGSPIAAQPTARFVYVGLLSEGGTAPQIGIATAAATAGWGLAGPPWPAAYAFAASPLPASVNWVSTAEYYYYWVGLS